MAISLYLSTPEQNTVDSPFLNAFTVTHIIVKPPEDSHDFLGTPQKDPYL